MTTPLSVLQENRRKIPKEEIQSFEDFKENSLRLIAKKFNSEVDGLLIQAIENKPYLDTWNVFIKYRVQYSEFFVSIEDFIVFLEKNLKSVDGFVSIVTKDIFTSTDRRFPYRSVRVIFKEA